MNPISEPARARAQQFPHTRWSVVLAATQRPSPETDAALEMICRAYWFPLYSFVRRSGQSAHDAQDITQDFFRHLLEKHWLETADSGKGRLRTFLVTALRNFMAKEWRRMIAQKRGGALTHLPIDTVFAESRYAADGRPPLGAEATFDREWALTLLDLTMKRLEAEFVAAGSADEFEVLKGSLVAPRGSLDYAAVAAQLGRSEGASRVAVHRLRKRFRELYREEIAQTLPDGTELEDELRHLAAALGAA